MLPSSWDKILADSNITSLRSSYIEWADYVFMSAMYIQKESVNTVILECKKFSKKIVDDGPLFTQEYSLYPQIDYFILNEAKIIMLFFRRFKNREIQKTLRDQRICRSFLIAGTRFSFIVYKDYAFMNIQVSRGCPLTFNFCEITSLLEHKVWLKNISQIISEYDVLFHKIKWRRPVSIVDDNFIWKESTIKNKLLPVMIE
jgi:hypothetical protein